MRTYKNILRHEFIGLECEVVKSQNKSQIGTKGRIVEETMKTISIKNIGLKRVQKKGTTFRIALKDETVDIEGNYIISRPEDRIKKKIVKW